MELKFGKKATMAVTKKNTKKKEKQENLKEKRRDETKEKESSKNLQKKSKEKKVRSSLQKKSKVKKVRSSLQKIKLSDDEEEAEKSSQISEYYSEEEETSGDELNDGASPSRTVVARKRGDTNTSGGVSDDNDSFHSAVESDSSEDEVAPRNTIGEVPLEFYKDEEHIGYDVIGRKIKKKDRKDKLDAFLANVDDKKSWRRFIDEYNDEEVELTKKETKMINRILKGKTPHADVNPYEPYVDWFVWEGKGHPLSNAPEPKRRFIPSKSEAKKIKKYVRAIREGRITFEKPKEKEKVYLLWGDDSSSSGKTRGLSYIPPPKAKLPGHEEAYNPSLEYLPTQEEINSYQLMYEEDRPTFIPTSYTSLRSVPAYANFLKELFARCLDLYLCPRVIKKRVNIDPESLKKKLPDPKDLRPYPTTCYIEYKGHSEAVVTISTDSSGQWIASGSTDGTVRVWEVATGRCVRVWEVGSSIRQVAWNPSPDLPILAVSVDQDVLILDTGLGSEEEQGKIKDLLHMQKSTISDESGDAAIVSWLSDDKLGGLRLKHSKTVTSIEWHRKGDYLSTVIPAGESRAIMIHQLSRKGSQRIPFKLHGLPVSTAFHPVRSIFFISTKKNVRVYDLLKEKMIKKIDTGLREVSCIAVHPGGDNVIIGSREGKLCWFDMDLSSVKPYANLKIHKKDITNVSFHRSYPLFASCSEDGKAYVFHGMVYSDLNQNPLIVPLRILQEKNGILDCKFHPRQPWLFTAGANSVIRLYCH
ncbi:ribosome biogenesis protein BOP1 homolog isoform X2 [Chenopodium quinoa]|uniref:ribosome biogenesis protein BOP1 homolog isoform X2 n=1 Tax=Chenopodium quinoa TaxID=63459 RepID=UPI000B770060|nr:ribosome biogenesis protein BOP1 homolog isoform X2 [Chenopodium quinoa]